MSKLDPKIYKDFIYHRKIELRDGSGIPRNLLKYSWNDYLPDRIKIDDVKLLNKKSKFIKFRYD